MNFLKLTMIDTPSPRDADASKKFGIKRAKIRKNKMEIFRVKLE